jgi:hypothetical protein
MLHFTPYALPKLVKLLLVTIAAIVVVWALWVGRRGQTSSANRCVRFFSAVMVATYVVFLAVYNSFTDPAVDLGPRVALPTYLFGMILLFSLIDWPTAIGKRRILFWCVILAAFVLFCVNAKPASYWVAYAHREGEGFTSRAWKGSEAVKFMKALPPQVAVYSNAADAYYLFTKREALRLPAKFDPTQNRVNPDFEEQMAVLQDDLKNKHALVVYFDRVNWRWYLPNRRELEETYKLPVATRLTDGVVYGAESEALQHSELRQ